MYTIPGRAYPVDIIYCNVLEDEDFKKCVPVCVCVCVYVCVFGEERRGGGGGGTGRLSLCV